MFDDYAREILLPYKMSTLGPCLDIGDVNNDQLTDFYLGGSSNLDGQLFLQNEFGGFIKSEFGPKKLYKECEEVDALFLTWMMIKILIYLLPLVEMKILLNPMV